MRVVLALTIGLGACQRPPPARLAVQLDLDGEDYSASSTATGSAKPRFDIPTIPLRRCAPGPEAAQGRSAIAGWVQDAFSGARLAGVTVVASAPGVHDCLGAITSDEGFYRIDGLRAGVYVVRFYYADLMVERTGIAVDGTERVTPVWVRMGDRNMDRRILAPHVILIGDQTSSTDPMSTLSPESLELVRTMVRQGNRTTPPWPTAMQCINSLTRLGTWIWDWPLDDGQDD